MDITDIIPDSANDIGAIVFWIITLILIIAIVVLYLHAKKMSKKVVKMQETRFQSPYAITWQSKPGKHIFRAVATDRAGYQSEATREFTVAP